VANSVFTVASVPTPTTQPRKLPRSHWLPKPAYTTPFMSSIAVRCPCANGSNASDGSLEAVPSILTGQPARSSKVMASTACMKNAATPEVPAS
jgi:hypothetical protein